MLNADLSRLEKPRNPKSTLSTTQEDSLQGLRKKECTGKPEAHFEANPHAKTMRRDAILRQAKNRKVHLDKAAAALEAKSDEKGLRRKKPAVGRKAAQGTKKPAAEKQPAGRRPPQRKRRLLCTRTLAYSVSASSF